MNSRLYLYAKNTLFPCLAFSAVAGFFTALLVTAFKIAVEQIIHISLFLYGAVRENPIWLPFLIVGAALLGLLASFLLSYSRSCRGGGIPTSVTAIRGIVNFRWIAGVFFLPVAALLTFLCGLPLGTEGPCVQMGTAVGDGVAKHLSSKNQKGWRRYVMTGGASAGFSIATASPITAIIFSIEELHKHFSPLLLTVASVSVISAQITSELLSLLGIGGVKLFQIEILPAIDISMLFAPLAIGIVSGICSILFSLLYHRIDTLMHYLRHKLSIKLVFPVLFACTAIIGFFLPDALGTGHSLTAQLLSARVLWYLLILVFLIRMVLMVFSNTSGVTGGVFLPTLAFGAIIGSVGADAMIALGWLSADCYPLMVVLGIASFIGATSRIPITACVFAIEALGGIHNVLSIIVATTVALLTVELSGLEDFTDTVIHSKIKSINKGKTPTVIEASLTVKQDSFVVGKELRDILWPNACVIVSFDRAPMNRGKQGIAEGDVLTVHYTTYNPSVTAQEFDVLVGEQSDSTKHIMIPHAEGTGS